MSRSLSPAQEPDESGNWAVKKSAGKNHGAISSVKGRSGIPDVRNRISVQKTSGNDSVVSSSEVLLGRFMDFLRTVGAIAEDSYLLKE